MFDNEPISTDEEEEEETVDPTDPYGRYRKRNVSFVMPAKGGFGLAILYSSHQRSSPPPVPELCLSDLFTDEGGTLHATVKQVSCFQTLVAVIKGPLPVGN